MIYKIYADGAASKNGFKTSVGGWAFIVIDSGDEIIKKAYGAIVPATNNICELSAIIKGCEWIKEYLKESDQVIVHSDSAYCINCFKEKWYKAWLLNDWKNSKKKLVKNKELWEQLIPFFEDSRFLWIKVKGHSGDYYNELVDRMAVQAREL